MKKHRYIFIMAGGSGERFWPVSTKGKPKHLFSIVGEGTMLDQTLERVEALAPEENIFIITNAAQKENILAYCNKAKAEQILLEPEAKNTAPVVAFAALFAQEKNPNANLLILPADAYIPSTTAFVEDVNQALDFSGTKEALLTLGIVADRPATGYGYIERAENIEGRIFKLKQFVEKPDLTTAQHYLDAHFLWNSGMIVASAENLLKAFDKHAPEYAAVIDTMQAELRKNMPWKSVLAENFKKFPKNSFDYIIWEKTDKAYVLEASFRWDDVGEWTALDRHEEKDSLGNVLKGTVTSHNSKNNIIVNTKESHVVVTSGIEDCVVVQTENATLICKKNEAQNIKELLNKIREKDELKAFL